MAWNYDNNFRVTSRSINGANTINFGYDNDSLLTQAGALTLSRNSQNGLLTGTTLGNVTDSWGYNNFAEPTSYSASVSGSAVFSQTFTRDKLGRITTKTETIQGVTDTYAYGYDAAGRLETVTKNGSLISQYTYDANGNRLSCPANHESRTPDHVHLRRSGPAAFHSELSTQHSVLLHSQRRTAIQDQRHRKPRPTYTTSSATSATSRCPMALRSTTSSTLKTAVSARRSMESSSRAGSTAIN